MTNLTFFMVTVAFSVSNVRFSMVNVTFLTVDSSWSHDQELKNCPTVKKKVTFSIKRLHSPKNITFITDFPGETDFTFVCVCVCVFLLDTCPFVGPLIPLFWTSGDVTSWFQRESGFCLIRPLQRHTWYTFPEIHLWCDTFAVVLCQHSSQSPSPHACFSRGGMPTSYSAVWRATHLATATGLCVCACFVCVFSGADPGGQGPGPPLTTKLRFLGPSLIFLLVFFLPRFVRHKISYFTIFHNLNSRNFQPHFTRHFISQLMQIKSRCLSS